VSAPAAPRAPTFRGRIALAFTLLCFAVLAATSVAIYLGVRAALVRNVDAALMAIARVELASAIDPAGGGVRLHDEQPSPISLPADSGYVKFAEIVDGGGVVRARTFNLLDGPPLALDPTLVDRSLHGVVSFAEVGRGTQRLRALYRPLVSSDGTRYAAVVAIPVHPIDRTLEALAAALAVSLALACGGAAWGASRLAGRLTRPLERIAEAARAVGGDDPTARIPEDARDFELRTVAARLNEMLERLHRALAAERQAVAAQRRFVADASHELRTPLANLRGAVEVALRRPRDAEAYRATLTTAQAEIERLGRLVGDLLTLSRADAGHLALRRAPCDLAAIATAAVEAAAPRAELKTLQLALEAPAPVAIAGDADRLREVLDNLLDNAIRHGPPGSAVRVIVSAEGGGGRLVVSDAGPGIAPDARAEVFERFFRIDASGAGLGLAIAKVLVEAHGGSIRLDSASPHGARFTVSLPCPATPPSQERARQERGRVQPVRKPE
jgi:two-component system OmpR family sensor kinase